ncbi:MAG: flagellar hook-basal body complex protein [Sedimentisphaerales bacterium]|nr:flagellar hook-basal body complex protein [Sedimentisphaerales bacterium]
MGLTSSMFTGLTGMKTNEFRMDVVGNNIANVNTYAYKSSSVSFQNQFLHTFSFGSAPNGTMGGTNPLQVGTGSMIGSVNRNFAGGAPETTGNKSDLAIQGKGMFILKKPDGSEVYTRDGGFRFNSENYLLSADGFFLQGMVDGEMGNLCIPIGEMTMASPTSNATFSGDLNSQGDAAASRPVLDSQALFQDAAGTVAAVAGTALTSLYENETAVVKLFETGNVITLAEASKGGANLAQEEFIVGTTGSTLGDLAAWLEDVLGINTSADLPDWTAEVPPILNPGVTISAVDGSINIMGNIGLYNNLTLETGSITAGQGTGASAPGNTLPLRFTNTTVESTLGESIRTSFRAYDSLGNPLNINVTMVMQDKDDTGITWRFFAESSDDTDFDLVLGTGTVKFDPNGQYLEGDNLSIIMDRTDTGAATPQVVAFDFTGMDGYAMTVTSVMSILSQDGFKSGTLQDYSIGPDGYITGSFTNGLTQNLGQVVLGTFRNYEGLIADTGNVYLSGPNSGDCINRNPQELGAGTINPGALELSNVDLSREFINLIITSSGFTASSRVIQTSDQLLSELMMLTR